jgi:hypothetical protein
MKGHQPCKPIGTIGVTWHACMLREINLVGCSNIVIIDYRYLGLALWLVVLYMSNEAHHYLHQLPDAMITWIKPPVLIGCNGLHIYPAHEQSSLQFGSYKLWDDDPPRTYPVAKKLPALFWPRMPHARWISSTNETTIRSPQAPSNESNLPRPEHEQNLEHTQTPKSVKQGQHLPTCVDQTTAATKGQQHSKKIQQNPKRGEFTPVLERPLHWRQP